MDTKLKLWGKEIAASGVYSSGDVINLEKQDGAKAMVHLMRSKNFHRWSKEVGLAFVILILTIFASIFFGQFAFLKGWEAIYKGFLRFFRLTLLLCLPVYLLLPIYSQLGRVVRNRAGVLIQMEEKQELEIHPAKHLLFRPFQGIGIGLLFGIKLLSVLQIVAGTTATFSLFLPQGQFQLGRFLIVTGITVFVSLLLSTFWTLDDMGIRYFNRKNHEIKMVGKYMGTFMPVLFGFYGIFSLFGEYSKTEALLYLFQIVVILYPPFTVFGIFHAHFVRRNIESLSKRLFPEKRDKCYHVCGCEEMASGHA
jgi:hypothetical protein